MTKGYTVKDGTRRLPCAVLEGFAFEYRGEVYVKGISEQEGKIRTHFLSGRVQSNPLVLQPRKVTGQYSLAAVVLGLVQSVNRQKQKQILNDNNNSGMMKGHHHYNRRTLLAPATSDSGAGGWQGEEEEEVLVEEEVLEEEEEEEVGAAGTTRSPETRQSFPEAGGAGGVGRTMWRRWEEQHASR